MTIEVETPDGVVEFPDGTPPETIKAALNKKYKPPTSSAGGSFLRGMTAGGTMNFGDEIAAVANAVIPGLAAVDRTVQGNNQQAVWDTKSPGGFWATIKHNMADLARQQKTDEAQHPTATRSGNVVGTIAGVVKGGPLLAKAAGKVLPRAAGRALIPAAARLEAAAIGAPVRTAIAKGAVIGGASGAASGFGAGDTLKSRRKSAATAGLAGTVLGGTVGGTVAGLAPVVGRYWNAWRGKGTEREALAQITRALKLDGYDVTSPAGKKALETELGRFAGKPVSLADVGSATRARTGVGLRTPNAAQQQTIDKVMSRQQGQADRLSKDIRATVAPRTDVHALDEALVKQRAEDALPLRDAALFEPPSLPAPVTPRPQIVQAPDAVDDGVARTIGRSLRTAPVEPSPRYVPVPVAQPAGPPAPIRQFRVIEDPTLQQLARLPDAQKALQAAVQRAQSEVGLKSVLGQPVDDIPDMTPGADLDMRTFDYLKRFLDDEVRTLYKGADTSTFKAAQAGQVKDLRNAIRDRLKKVVPEYGQYLESYKGSSDLIDALQAGRGFNKLDPEAITKIQGEATDGEKEFFRVGAARSLEDQVRSVSDTGTAQPAARIMNTPIARDRVAALGLSPDELARLNAAAAQERQLGLLPGELRGSATDQRLAARQDADAGVGASIPFNPTQPLGWLGMLGRKAAGAVNLKHNAAINAAALPRLTEQNPAAIQATIDQLEAAGRTADALKLRRLLQAQMGAAIGGAIIGSPLAIRDGE